MYSLEMILIQRMNDFLISSSKSFFDFYKNICYNKL